jgi:hypothetical protein
LSPEDSTLFTSLDTTNFEGVLSTLKVAEIVCRSIGVDVESIRTRHNSIRIALMEASRASMCDGTMSPKGPCSWSDLSSPVTPVKRKLELMKTFTRANLRFFDAATYALEDPALNVG